MRKMLLLAALCALTLLAVSPALAQDDLNCPDLSEAEEQAVFAADPASLDPNNLDADDDGVPCEDDTTDNGSFVPSGGGETTTMMEGTTTMMGGTTMMEPTTVAPTAGQYDATPTPDASPAPLPETGGPSMAAFALPALALLVTGAIFATRIVRR